MGPLFAPPTQLIRQYIVTWYSAFGSSGWKLDDWVKFDETWKLFHRRVGKWVAALKRWSLLMHSLAP